MKRTSNMKLSSIVHHLESLFSQRGQVNYGEGVTMAEHALQCARLARAEQASEALVAAALLHDVGQFIESPDDEFGYHAHDTAGFEFLSAHFGDEVCYPVKLHVTAKRYLCATEADYHSQLSRASVHSLQAQGGPMTPSEVRAFEGTPFWREALRLRRWDDRAKVVGLSTPGFESFRNLLQGQLREPRAQ